MNKIITKEFNGFEILFSIDKELYLHITPIAKKFKKQPRDWLKTKDTKDYINVLSKILEVSKENLVIIHQGGKSNEQGTWIHKKLVVLFARWLSPEFAIWCDQQIEDILSGHQQPIKTRDDLISVSTEEMRKELEVLKFILDNFNFSEKEKIEFINQSLKKINFQTLENPHLKKYEPVFTLTQLLKEFDVNIRTADFNRKLESFGVIQRAGNGWILLDMKFGENRQFKDGLNHRYYKSTFRELLNLVFDKIT